LRTSVNWVFETRVTVRWAMAWDWFWTAVPLLAARESDAELAARPSVGEVLARGTGSAALPEIPMLSIAEIFDDPFRSVGATTAGAGAGIGGIRSCIG